MGPQVTIRNSRIRTTLSPRGRQEQRPEQEPEQRFETTRRPITPLGLLDILNVLDTTLEDVTSSTDPDSMAPYKIPINTALDKAQIIREDFLIKGEISPEQLEELYDIVVTLQGISDVIDSLNDPLATDQVKKTSDDLIRVTIFLSSYVSSTTSTLSPQVTIRDSRIRTTLSPSGRHEQRPEQEPEQIFVTTRKPVTPLGLLDILN